MRRVAAASESPAIMERWRLVFAGAIAADGRAMLYVPGGANNAEGKWIALPAAIRSGRPYLVPVHPRMLATDADGRDAKAKVGTLADLLAAAGLRPVIVASGQSGRRHLFCRTPDTKTHAHFSEAAKALGLDVRQTIRPPLSPHRLAGCSFPIQPADWRIALAALVVVPPRRHALSPAMGGLLQDGDA